MSSLGEDEVRTEDLGVRKRPRRKRTMTVAEVAKLRQTSNFGAYKWLLRHAKAHMLKVNGAWTVPTAVVTKLCQAVNIEHLINRITVLEERADLLERRLNAVAWRAGPPPHSGPTPR
jgi:hypothetical protein